MDVVYFGDVHEPQAFQVNLLVVEASRLPAVNIDTRVVVTMGRTKRAIRAKTRNTESPLFNELCMFYRYMPLTKLLTKTIIIRVEQVRNYRCRNKQIGECRIELSSVWPLPQHRICNQWLDLNDPYDILGELRGYVRCELSILTTGAPSRPIPWEKPDEFPKEQRQRVRFLLTVYRADGLSTVRRTADTFVLVTFAGHAAQTTVRKGTLLPEWNERLEFHGTMSSFSQTITIQVIDRRTSLGSVVLDLRTISQPGTKGFLPTFGPSFLYLHRPWSQTRSSYSDASYFTFGCRLLFSIRTEVIYPRELAHSMEEQKQKNRFKPESIPPLNENDLWDTNEFVLFGAVFDILILKEKLKVLKTSVKITFGPWSKLREPEQQNNAEKHEGTRVKSTLASRWGKKKKIPVKRPPKTGKPIKKRKGLVNINTKEKKVIVSVKKKKPIKKAKKMKIEEKDKKESSEIPLIILDYEDLTTKVNETLSATKSKNLIINRAKRRSKKESFKQSTKQPDLSKIKTKAMQINNVRFKTPSVLSSSIKSETKANKRDKFSFKRRKPALIPTKNNKKIVKKGNMEISKTIPKPSRTLVPPEKLESKSKITKQSSATLVFNQEHKETPPYTTSKLSNGLRHVDFSGKFPTTVAKASWPEKRYQMWIRNKHEKLIAMLKTGALGVQEQALANPKKAFTELQYLLKSFCNACNDMMKNYQKPKMATALEELKAKLYKEELEKLQKEVKGDLKNYSKGAVEDQLQMILYYVERLQTFTIGPDGPFPDLEIWLLTDKNRVIGHQRVKAHEILYSDQADERGVNCGKMQTIILRGKDNEVVAKVDCVLWLGTALESDHCLAMLPQGYDPQLVQSHPYPLVYESPKTRYQCRVHVLQAKVLHGADTTGLADPFVVITAVGQQMSTATIPATLTPRWDETLFFPELTFYGSPEAVKAEPMTVLVEVYDRDAKDSSELIGRAILKPVVKLQGDAYRPPRFPPKLKWVDFYDDFKESGAIDIAIELFEGKYIAEQNLQADKIYRIPEDIRPHWEQYQLEVFFWGIRNMTNWKKHLTVDIECAGQKIVSPVIRNPKKNPNFPRKVGVVMVDLPREDHYFVPLSMKLCHKGNFISHSKYLGNCMLPSIKTLVEEPLDQGNRNATLLIIQRRKQSLEEERAKLIKQPLFKKVSSKHTILRCLRAIINRLISFFHKVKDHKQLKEATKERTKTNWWVKYYSEDFNIYSGALEEEEEFGGFTDYLQSYMFTKGKFSRVKRLTSDTVATLKACIRIRKEGVNLTKEQLTNFPMNEVRHVMVRVYVVRALSLAPQDRFGRADPYIVVKLGRKKLSNRRHHKSMQLNPMFGKCFEMKGVLPFDHTLILKVMDYDIFCDDLIGETKVDIENRFYTKHRAFCGLQATYEETGYNRWRGMLRPTEVLDSLCKQYELGPPEYTERSVAVDTQVFSVGRGYKENTKEQLALNALHKWQEIPEKGFSLVPEHIETRRLYHPKRPGMEQGKVQMWVDVFPADRGALPPKLDITPSLPEPMELRCIVWNTTNVPLLDTPLFGDKMSDIYVLGWLASPEEFQVTDTHYRSLNGEGNFNWRFVFPFQYVSEEHVMVITKGGNPMIKRPDEEKQPCTLQLQVWDNDVLEDDYIGSLSLDLSAMPRGAKLATRCSLSILEAEKINLFTKRHIRGWWPFRRHMKIMDTPFIAGKVELELEVLTREEARRSPAGLGRKEPQALNDPARPDTSFNFIMNPVAALRYYCCVRLKTYFCILCCVFLLLAFFALGIYSIPGYAVKKLMGV